MAISCYSFKNKKLFLTSKTIACYCCMKSFTMDDIVCWLDNNETALCPFCGIDSVVGFLGEVDMEFLKIENQNQFGVI